MSKKTLSRIPKNVQHIFRVYETAAHAYRPYEDRVVSRFVDKTGSYYDMFNRRKLLSANIDPNTPIFNPADFPPVTRDIVARIFETPLNLEENLSIEFKKDPTLSPQDDPIFGSWHTTAKHFSDYQARILSMLASYYRPASVVSGAANRNSLKWYQRLLANTPVVFFLRQKQRLMTESSLRGINKPLDNLRECLNEVCEQYIDDPNIDRRIRNYHLTDLISTDIFKLAVNTEHEHLGAEQSNHSDDSETKKTGSSGATKYSPSESDKLCALLHRLREPVILQAGEKKVSFEALERMQLPKEYPVAEVEAALDKTETPQISSVFPYDIQYNDLFMLTIETPVLRDDHEELLSLLFKQEHFEVVAARISRTEALQLDLEVGPSELPDTGSGPTYTQLLDWAERQHSMAEGGHVSRILERLGERGLVEVEESASGSAFYIMKQEGSGEKSG